MSNFSSDSNIAFLIDDNSIDNFIHKKMVELSGLFKEVKTYINSRDALNYLSDIDELNYTINHIPSIIFLDLNMPLTNGFQFMEIYARLPSFIHSRCKIVILTSSLDPADKLQAIVDKHILAFFNKPLSIEHFSHLNELMLNNSATISFDNYLVKIAPPA